ncbi:helix-turn-helix domain-containing protein [Pseudoalteromonas sp. CnMc7-15]|uniref:helix-turn-helix domain-containing protein n=1 Tax=unclassified Pseudoalteromonas TaxID=194690 RepID=UPI001EF519E4|nr:helix-turn-helix domain-containing protein [Pseudoalteromonas sp. CnMc7-15]MCG7567096.1 helix-turn-helix domain-containing protein [Pseudoalteromonas sp. CnMc7-15]
MKVKNWYKAHKRDQRGNVRNELARTLGVSPNTAKAYLTEMRPIPARYIRRVSEFTGFSLTPDEILLVTEKLEKSNSEKT